MPEWFPPLPSDLVAYTERGVSVLIGTASRDGTATCMRGAGVRVWPGACQLTVLAPSATAAVSIADLRDNPRIAITLAYIPTHFTVQIKGRVLAIRDGDEADRAMATAYRERHAADMAWIGQPNVARLAIWPCLAIDVEIAVVYAQTPGPRAGDRLPLSPEPA